MFVIQTKQDLDVLKKANVINQKYMEVVEKQFMNLYKNLGEEGILLNEFSLTDEGEIILLEIGDNLRNLSVIGLDPTGGLLEVIPEFINEIEIEESILYEVIIAYNNQFAITLYVPAAIVDKEIMEWIEEYK
ncbi:hypothetical protein [Clostridium drakei]|uniref:Uncharacterized protein n=1 Tax=Clostridium drakei TaxID=332101 RepID=A0A2U8DLN6_9CLOT|nr:hypothetical protein [Clostridium drakei]AWI03122.1 hypothetical protein B9W14_00900 [Clostridium drakei]